MDNGPRIDIVVEVVEHNDTVEHDQHTDILAEVVDLYIELLVVDVQHNLVALMIKSIEKKGF